MDVLAGVKVVSEVMGLMMVFVVGASMCATTFGMSDVSRITEVAGTTVPAGTHQLRSRGLGCELVEA